MKNNKKSLDAFTKSYPGLSYLLSPNEERFLKHMVEIEYLHKCGQKTDFTRPEYMKRMGLREHTFDSCAKTLCELELIVKSSDSARNKVNYLLNRPVYDKLILIVSATRNHHRLIEFFDFNILKLDRSLESVTEEEIEALRL